MSELREAVVIPSIMDMIELANNASSILKEDELSRLRRAAGKMAPSSSHTEVIRLRCALMYSVLFTSRVIRYADVPYVSDLMLTETRRIGQGMTGSASICFAAVYRLLLDRLLLAGPRMHEPIMSAAKACASCIHGSYGVSSGQPLPVAQAFVETAILATQRDRKAWLKQIEEALEMLACADENTQLDFNFT